jgi:hypothetical protein
VHEHIFAAAIGCNEAEAFGGVEPFHGASSHIRVLLSCVAIRGSAMARRWSVWIEGLIAVGRKTVVEKE